MGSSWFVSAAAYQLLLLFLLIDCLVDYLLHALTRFPDANSHSCRMLRTNAPSDTMPHLSWLECDPARCVNWAARGPDSSGRWACGMACGNDADCVRFFRPPTVSVATRTLTSGARRNGRRARDAGRSCMWLPTLVPTLVAWTAVLALSLRVAYRPGGHPHDSHSGTRVWHWRCPVHIAVSYLVLEPRGAWCSACASQAGPSQPCYSSGNRLRARLSVSRSAARGRRALRGCDPAPPAHTRVAVFPSVRGGTRRLGDARSCGYFEVLKLSRLLILLWCRLTAISAQGVLSYPCHLPVPKP
jgi:hypothetical protein